MATAARTESPKSSARGRRTIEPDACTRRHLRERVFQDRLTRRYEKRTVAMDKRDRMSSASQRSARWRLVKSASECRRWSPTACRGDRDPLHSENGMSGGAVSDGSGDRCDLNQSGKEPAPSPGIVFSTTILRNGPRRQHRRHRARALEAMRRKYCDWRFRQDGQGMAGDGFWSPAPSAWCRQGAHHQDGGHKILRMTRSDRFEGRSQIGTEWR